MYSKLYKIIGIFSFLTILGLISPPIIKACTYQATITGNHLDFQITSDINELGLIQYIRQSGTALITKLYSPNIGESWFNSDDPCNTDTTKPLACRQNRGQLGDSAYWIWSVNGDGNFPNHPLPTGIWGMDFDTEPTYESLKIEYGSHNGVSLGDFWQACDRIGNIGDPTPTPNYTTSPSPSPLPSSTLIESPSPLPTNTPTQAPTNKPSPTPTPLPTTIPVNKVFFIPGIGASWNADALMNCKNSGYSGDWSMASYARPYYKEIINQLPDHNWGTYPFYYDWRQDIRQNAIKLTNLINANTNPGEKVNIVGHSMGGLIGRNYLETQNGGKASKFMAVGAPFQGSAYSYPTLFNSEVSINNILDLPEKIAMTLQLYHCGIPDSIQNLLPTYNYLRDNSTKQLKDTASLKIKNNYLPTSFVNPFWGVKVGTLVGTGEKTLNIMKVVNDKNWPNGRPVDNEYTYGGDGTVLLQSAQIQGAYSNTIINQSHSGIIASTEGVSKILEFLGSPGITDPPYVGPKSALVIVGYPGTFWLTDKDGKVTQSEQGMISIMDPKDGDYQLQIIPQSTNTNFIVAQFLTNGKTLYKEYKFKGATIDPKIIHFDNKSPNEDCVHNISEYKKPNFPKFWQSFWSFWNKYH